MFKYFSIAHFKTVLCALYSVRPLRLVLTY